MALEKHVLCYAVRDCQGRVRRRFIDGNDCNKSSNSCSSREGSVCSQETSVFKGLSVLDNLKVASELHQTRPTKQDKDGTIDNY